MDRTVVFLRAPWVGHPAVIVVDGEQRRTSPVVRLQQHPKDSALFRIQTQSGKVYTGRLGDKPAEGRSEPRLDRARLELLSWLSRHPIDGGSGEMWSGIVGSLESAIDDFTRRGLLVPASLADKLGRKYRVVDLRSIARDAGYRVSGSKDAIIASLIESLSAQESSRLVADVRAYAPTEKGRELIAEYAQFKKDERSVMEQDALQRLLRGDVQGAWRLVAAFKTRQIFPGLTGGVSSQDMGRETAERVGMLLREPCADLLLPRETRRQVSARLALTELSGGGFHLAASLVLDATGGVLPCPPLIEYLKTKPDAPLSGGASPDKPKDLAFLYAHTKICSVANAVWLAELATRRFGKGVSITYSGDSCRLCRQGKHRYGWGELPSLPKLPRHWGCRCLYLSWSDE